MVAKVSKSSVSSKVAFFMKEQEKEKKNAISAKVAFFQEKSYDKSPRKRAKCSKSGIRSKLAIFQKKEHEAAKILKKQRDVELFFQERRHKKVKAQTKQNKFSIGSAVTTISNPIFTGTVVNNLDNGIVPVKLKWAVAYISKHNLKLAKGKTTVEVTKRKREENDTNQRSYKKNKYAVKPQTKQNVSEHPTIIESSITQSSSTTQTLASTPMKQKNEPISSDLEAMDTDIVEPINKDTESPIVQSITQSSLDISTPASIPTPNVEQSLDISTPASIPTLNVEQTPISTPMKQENEPTSSGLEAMDTDVVEPINKDTKSPIGQPITQPSLDISTLASIPIPNKEKAIIPCSNGTEVMDILNKQEDIKSSLEQKVIEQPSSNDTDTTPSSIKQNNSESLSNETTKEKNTQIKATQDSLTTINGKETILKNEPSTITQNNAVNLPVIA